MKHRNIMIGKQGYAKRNRGTGILNWKLLMKTFPTHAEHVYRVRKNFEKLVTLRNKLVMKFGISGNFFYPKGDL